MSYSSGFQFITNETTHIVFFKTLNKVNYYKMVK